jgi:Domain of unknown function (DUF4136)
MNCNGERTNWIRLSIRELKEPSAKQKGIEVKLKNCFAFIQALMALAIFAHGQDVHYNYDRSADFASYKTYQWVELPNQVSDQLIDRDVKRSIDEQLAQKGLTTSRTR